MGVGGYEKGKGPWSTKFLPLSGLELRKVPLTECSG